MRIKLLDYGTTPLHDIFPYSWLLVVLILVSCVAGCGREKLTLRQKAESGDAVAQAALGADYYSGNGVPQDYVEAVKWYSLSAKQGNPESQRLLGGCYFLGNGTPKDYAEGARWCRLAAEQGDVSAACMLGLCYKFGRGVQQDYTESAKWFRFAAEKGNSEAQVSLATQYDLGVGVPQDYEEAVKWHHLSAKQGSVLSQARLGSAYYNGKGVSRDYTEAIKWLRLAAEQGNLDAQNNLGYAYFHGNGVQKDAAQAYVWWNIAATNGADRTVEQQTLPAMARLYDQLVCDSRTKPHDNAIETAKKACVFIEFENGHGSGFLISDDGYLITNWHVIAGKPKLTIRMYDGRILQLQYVAAYSVAQDLALLKVFGAGLPCMNLIRSDELQQGDALFAMGHPHDSEWVLTKGYLAGWKREADRKCLQFSADISPGNSGGPIFNSQGNACAVATFFEVHKLAEDKDKYVLDPSEVFKFGVTSEEVLDLIKTSQSTKFSLDDLLAVDINIKAIELLQLTYKESWNLFGLLSSKTRAGIKRIEQPIYEMLESGRVKRDAFGDPVISRMDRFLLIKDPLFTKHVAQLRWVRDIINPCVKIFEGDIDKNIQQAGKCLVYALNDKIFCAESIIKNSNQAQSYFSETQIPRSSQVFREGLRELNTATKKYDDKLVNRDLVEAVKKIANEQ
jgi:TPR repeat protein